MKKNGYEITIPLSLHPYFTVIRKKAENITANEIKLNISVIKVVSVITLCLLHLSFFSGDFQFFKEICRYLPTPQKFRLRSWLHFVLVVIQVIPNTLKQQQHLLCLTATNPFRPITLSCLLTVEELPEIPVNFFRSDARVELDFLPSIKDDSFKNSLSDGESFGGLRSLAWLL